MQYSMSNTDCDYDLSYKDLTLCGMFVHAVPDIEIEHQGSVKYPNNCIADNVIIVITAT